MARYDSARYAPPAPVAIVQLRPSDQHRSVDGVSLLIDTGADTTLLPRSAVNQLGIKPTAVQYDVIGFDGTRSKLDAVDLELIFLNKAYSGRYLLSEDDHGILGRDVLASLVLIFGQTNRDGSELSRPMEIQS